LKNAKIGTPSSALIKQVSKNICSVCKSKILNFVVIPIFEKNLLNIGAFWK